MKLLIAAILVALLFAVSCDQQSIKIVSPVCDFDPEGHFAGLGGRSTCFEHWKAQGQMSCDPANCHNSLGRKIRTCNINEACHDFTFGCD